MSKRRFVLLLTALAVAALAAVFAWVGWNQAGQIATVFGGLAAVAAVGVAMWAALPVARSTGSPSATSGDPQAGEEASSSGPIPPKIEQHAEATDQARIYQAGRDQHINDK